MYKKLSLQSSVSSFLEIRLLKLLGLQHGGKSSSVAVIVSIIVILSTAYRVGHHSGMVQFSRQGYKGAAIHNPLSGSPMLHAIQLHFPLGAIWTRREFVEELPLLQGLSPGRRYHPDEINEQVAEPPGRNAGREGAIDAVAEQIFQAIQGESMPLGTGDQG